MCTCVGFHRSGHIRLIFNSHLRDMGIESFILMSSYAIRGLQFLFAHFANIAIKCKHLI